MAVSHTNHKTATVASGLLLVCLFSTRAMSQELSLGDLSIAVPDMAGSAPPQGPPPPSPGVLASDKSVPAVDKRIFGVLPNYRTAEKTAVYQPIPASYKLRIAFKDSFDYPLMFVSAAYAGLYQAENSHPQFGQGAEGYAKRLGTSYCDQVVGNFLTEGIMPILFREDPRYFRMSTGTKKARLGYALSRIVVTKTDSGKPTFNFAEIMGNGIAAGVGLSYYQDDRDPGDFLQNWGTQLATDAFSQVLKEFWPDIKHWYHRKHHPDEALN